MKAVRGCGLPQCEQVSLEHVRQGLAHTRLHGVHSQRHTQLGHHHLQHFPGEFVVHVEAIKQAGVAANAGGTGALAETGKGHHMHNLYLPLTTAYQFMDSELARDINRGVGLAFFLPTLLAKSTCFAFLFILLSLSPILL